MVTFHSTNFSEKFLKKIWNSFKIEYNFFSSTCLKLKGVAVITEAVLVDSCDMEGICRPTFQIWYAAGRGSAGTAGVVTSDLLGQHQVAVGSFRGIPRHPGRVSHTVQVALSVPGHTWSCRRWSEEEKRFFFVSVFNHIFFHLSLAAIQISGSISFFVKLFVQKQRTLAQVQKH